MIPAARTTRGPSASLLAFAIAVLLYGANFVAIRVVAQSIAPVWGALLRAAPSAALLAAVAFARGTPWPRGRTLGVVGVYGVLAFGVSPALIYWALQSMAAGMGSLLFATMPLFALLLAGAVRQEELRWGILWGIVLAVVGVGIVVGEPWMTATSLPPILLALGAAVCAAASVVVLKQVPPMDPVSVNAVGLGGAAGLLLAVSVSTGGPLTFPGGSAFDAALVFLILSTTTATVLLVYVLNRWKASAVSAQAVLSPPLTVLLAATLLGEPVGWTLVLGGALVLAGIWLTTVRRRTT